MTKNALVLHGTDGSPESNWLPWLKNQLSWRAFEVTVPQLPQANAPDIDRYWEVLKNYPYDEETVIVGHSSGAVTALEILERIDVVVDHVISVAGFYRDGGFNCQAMFKAEWDWDRIKAHARTIELWWAPDDPYVEKEQTDVLSHKLNIQPRIFPEGYKHFGVTAGGERFRQFAELSEAILSSQ